MPWQVPNDPVNPNAAIAFFRKKVPMTKDAWLALTERAREQAFTVAGVAQLDVVHDVWQAIDDAVANGTDFKAFTEAVGDTLLASWQGTVDNPGFRLETIFRTNVQHAYAAGREAAATDPDTLEDFPFWMFDATIDGRTTHICAEANGTILPANDHWWERHTPPCHFNCRSTKIVLTPEQAERFGGVSQKRPTAQAAKGFGGSPASVWKPDASKYPSELWNEYAAKTG